MRIITVVAISLVLSACVIANAFRLKKQFYPSVVYIIKSSPSVAILYLQALVALYLLGKLICKIFFGSLRAGESERLIDKAWFAVIETCLAFTVFKDDFSPKFVALFALLLFLKCFHWLIEDRVDYMEQTPIISYLFHVRVWLLLTLLTWADIYFVNEAYLTTMTEGLSVQFVFGFEYSLLIILAANAALKYVIHTVDIYSNHFWENKAVILLYLEFLTGLFKVMVYMAFLLIMVRIHTLPFFAFRSMYVALSNLKEVFKNLRLSRRAIRIMNTLFPNATIQDLQTIENVCIICREDMTVAAAKKLPCNHILHTSCLSNWFQHNQTCPICRVDILHTTPLTQPSASAAEPPHARTAQAAAATSHSFSNMNDVNNHGPYDNNLNNGLSQENDMFESRTAFVNAADLGAEIPLFFQNMPQANSIPPTIPLNMPFVGGISIPHPPIPVNLNALSDEELHLMEQNTRQACLARLKYVTDIKNMLDAAIVMMNQYSKACLIAGLDDTESTNNSTSETSEMTENDEQLDIKPPSNTFSENDSSSVSTSSSSRSDDHLLPQEETEQQRIVRQKRLKKFGNTGNNST